MRHVRVSVGLLAAGALGAAAAVHAASAAGQAQRTTPPRPQTSTAAAPAAAPTATGVRDAAWSADGKRLAVVWYDAIWTMAPDGQSAKRLVAKPGPWMTERDPAWSPTASRVAFAAEVDGEFHLWTADAGGGVVERVTQATGDDRWPAWTPDGKTLIYSHRDPKGAWHLMSVSVAVHAGVQPAAVGADDAAEWQGVVSPDGKWMAFVSDRDLTATGASEIWVRPFESADAKATRVTTSGGVKLHPAWAPDSKRVAYYASRPGQGAGVFVTEVPTTGADAPGTGARGGRGGGAGGGRGGGRAGAPAGPGFGGGAPGSPMSAASETSVLASRHAGLPTWSRDGEWLAIATFPAQSTQYNGNPERNDDDAPMVLSEAASYELWRVMAPRAVDQGAASATLPAPDAARWTAGFDQVWWTVKSLYYADAASASAKAWDALRDKYRPQAARVTDLASFEDVVDAMLLEQPPMKTGAESTHGVASSGSPLASRAGTEILEKGGNVVDAGIAVALALGVVEPDATSLGGDGQAILFLKGMTEPVVVEYKDMSPSHATADNPKLFTPTGGRTAPDGPTVANIPGVAAGLDLLYQKYGSKKVSWADIVAPAIKLADDGFILDEALPTTIEQGHAQFAKYPESAKLFLPGGKVPKPGDRFVNKDYAETLRVLAKEGGRSVYEGTIAKRIVADMEANGGVITAEDLAQYRAMERKPLVGRYRNHLVYSVPAPVSSGAQLIETLQILDNYQPKPGATYTTDPDYFHYVIDAWRVRDGGGRIADPERWPVDYGNHLEAGHAQERFNLLDPKKAWAGGAGGRGGGVLSGTSVATTRGTSGEAWIAEDESGAVQTGTTAFVVADAEGNMIAFTQTLSTWGGNYYVSKGLGFLYNDHFRGGGGRGGGFGSLLPLMRSNSTSVPTLVFAPSPVDPGRYGIAGYVPLMAVGCAGNSWIPASVYDIILNVVDGGMSAQKAIDAPRFLIGGGQSVQIEDRFPRAMLADLEARGHTFQKVGRKGEVKYGYASVAVVHAAKGTVEAGAEPRRSHGAVGTSK